MENQENPLGFLEQLGRTHLAERHTSELENLLQKLSADHSAEVSQALFNQLKAPVKETAAAVRKEVAFRIANAAIGEINPIHLAEISSDTNIKFKYLLSRFQLGKLISRRTSEEAGLLSSGHDPFFDFGWPLVFVSIEGVLRAISPSIYPWEDEAREKTVFVQLIADLKDGLEKPFNMGGLSIPPEELVAGAIEYYLNSAAKENAHWPDTATLWSDGRKRLMQLYEDFFEVPFQDLVTPNESPGKNWFQSSASRAPALAPDQIDLGTVKLIPSKQWLYAVSNCPWQLRATQISNHEIGTISSKLANRVSYNAELEHDKVALLLNEYLGAACPKCLGGITGEICQMLSAMKNAGGVVSSPEIAKLLEGKCPHCDNDESILIWKGAQ